MTHSPKSRKSLIILIILSCFLIPWFAARWLYHHHLPMHGTQHGTLITPPFSLHTVTWTPVRTNLHETALPEHQWLLLYFYPAHCGIVCRHDWHFLGQIQKSLGKDQKRVGRILIVYPETPLTTDQRRALTTTPIQLQLRAVNPLPWHRLMQNHFPTIPAKGTIFISDPHGNVILMYPPYTRMEYIRKDLQKLLELSQIG
ncbi:MAG: hypothetical protein A3J38_02515 [Gammaproteobacteria bacterium RIFCSPHIGHO2_12_FULL_45_9]|nr:MAG: hypothetical protein A3J38_02515 [Gammaproteobacteria bacterium RIFCSPHIGHO2_12_FULL_45_9]